MAEERKRSAAVGLTILGVVAGAVGINALGQGDRVQRNRYASIDECTKDYTDAQCRADMPIDGSRGSVPYHSYYYGPWYRSDLGARQRDATDPGPGRRSLGFAGGTAPSVDTELGRRGGFGGTGRVRSMSS